VSLFGRRQGRRRVGRDAIEPAKNGVKHEKRPAIVQSTIAGLLIYPAVKKI
jgi:hypothetical protein